MPTTKEVSAMKRLKWALSLVALAVLLLITFATGWIAAITGFGPAIDPATLPEHERQFVDRMKGVALVGVFTITGREDRPPDEDRYEIASVEKIGEDRWRFNARMRHGNTDITLPFAVPMRWVDDTPMIMMTDMTIPTLGAFTVRVFFHGERYAGTWQHGKVGGHMFGRIEPSNGGR
jgi:hypothetical protein